jgi:predicted TIM-barrel fold metal-dependent hydrolase
LKGRAFQALLAIGRERDAHIKLSGHYKFSQQPHPYEDTWPFIAALVEAFTLDRCVWGSDYPFLRAPERLDYGPLLAVLAKLFPDASDRHRLLWRTPARLLGFDGS